MREQSVGLRCPALPNQSLASRPVARGCLDVTCREDCAALHLLELIVSGNLLFVHLVRFIRRDRVSRTER